MAHDREVAGLRCLQVLEQLSAYLDGEVDTPARTRIEAHLAGCDWCERFGGQMAQVVSELRRQLAEPAPVPPEVEARLRARLARE